MIYDKLEKLTEYPCIPKVGLIREFLNRDDLAGLSEGDIEIDGKEIFVKVLKYLPKDASCNNFEIHKNYADIQVIIQGVEKMQITNTKNLKKVTDYCETDDYQFFSAEEKISDLIVCKNEFAVFFPGDIHKPGCLYESSNEPVFKLVFKVKIC